LRNGGKPALRSVMSRALRYTLAAGAALAAAALVLPFLVPTGIYKSQIEAGVSRATGRTFRIAGPLRLALFPAFGIDADDASLANAPGGRAPALLQVAHLHVDARLLPLLFARRLEIGEIALDRPDLHLEVDAQGHANWTLARPPAAKPGSAAPRPAQAPRVETLFSGIRIAHGRVTYANARTGDTRTLEDIDAQLDLATLDRPVALTGSFQHGGRRVQVTARLATPALLLAERETVLDASVSSALLRSRFTGRVTPDGTAKGRIAVDAPSLRGAAAWLGARMPSGGGFGPFSLEADVEGDNRTAALHALTLKLDGATIRGALALETHGPVQVYKGALGIDRLDVNPYIEKPPRPGGPQKPAPRRDTGWSDAPIALDILKKADAELTLDADAVFVRHLKLAKSHILVTLHGGDLVVHLDPVTLYGGTGKALLEVDARGKEPKFVNTLAFDHVALAPLFGDTIGVSEIEGTGALGLDLASQGASADAVMHGLSGSGKIAFRDGRLRGVDLGQVARSIASFLDGAAGPDRLTTYSAMDGSFTIANGVLTNKDFRLGGPLLSMTGEGTVDLGGRAIDFKVIPKATAEIDKKKITIGVPFRIEGPWAHVRYAADLSGLVTGVLDNLASGRAPFKGLFGGGKKPETRQPGPKKKHKNLGDALKNMFGIH
jgi:AsmA protein